MKSFMFSMAIAAALSGYGFAGQVSGTYLEARTCQVYTGPCFANGEFGLTGNNAVMGWNIDEGTHAGVDLKGLKVAVIVRASNTLGFRGLADAKDLKSVIVVDETANDKQRNALVAFVKSHAGKAGECVEEIRSAPMEMTFDSAALTGSLRAGDIVTLTSRKARSSDCICSNEGGYYPPLAQLTGSVPGVTIDGSVTAKSLGTKWSIPDSRTAYLGTFSYE
jgi:hypothetical protein